VVVILPGLIIVILLLFEKLDRFLVSPEWDLHYNNVNVTGLSRSFSDHVPLCLKTDVISPARREFRYELCWKFRPDFKSLVVNNWSLPVRSKIGIDIWKEKVKILKKNVERLEYQC
jgi:hypothetical protein